MNPDDAIRTAVTSYYAEVLQQSSDLKTNACCAVGAPSSYINSLLQNVHDDVVARFYGCGFPIPEALEATTALDLGCGTGRDVYLLAQAAGAKGTVIGIDMTEAQLEVAKRTEDWHRERFGFDKSNVRFEQGFIEDLASVGIADRSVDVVISNCVVNLSPRKDLVLSEVYRVLREGGELYFSDVFVDRRLPEHVAADPVLYGECLGGALYEGDFLSMARRAGFLDARLVSAAPITIENDEVEAAVGAAQFRSATYRLFKLPALDDRCEDYGQIATYRGTIPNVPVFTLDDHHVFEPGRPERVCGNTAAMLQDTRFAAHFDVVGDRSVHFGVFDCAATMAATSRRLAAENLSACC